MDVSRDHLQQAEEHFNTLAGLLGLAASVTSRAEKGQIRLEIQTDDPGRLIGRRGRTRAAMQVLLNGIVRKREDAFPRVVLNVAAERQSAPSEPRRESHAKSAYRAPREDRPPRQGRAPRENQPPRQGRTPRESQPPRQGRAPRESQPPHQERPPRREGVRADPPEDGRGGGVRAAGPRRSRDSEEDPTERVRLKALDAAKEVRKWGEPAILPPMSHDDRQLVHDALADEPDIEVVDGAGDPRQRRRVTIRLRDHAE